MTIYENQIKAIHSVQQIWIEAFRSQIELTAPVARIPSELVSFYWMTQANLKHDAKSQVPKPTITREQKPALKQSGAAPKAEKKPPEVVEPAQKTKSTARKVSTKPPLQGVADIRINPKSTESDATNQNRKGKSKSNID